MPTAAERLALLISADVRGAVRGLDQVGKSTAKNLDPSRAQKWGQGFTKAGVAMVGAGAAIGVALYKAAKASQEADRALLKLDNSLAANPRLAGSSSKAFTDLAQSIQAKTAADADEIIAGEAVLAQGKLTEAQMRTLIPLTVDYARKKGIDEVAAFTTASKAAGTNAKLLERQGIAVDENLAKTDNYKATVEALRNSVGGFATQEGATFEGKLERIKNQLGDVAEGVGGGAVDAFSELLDVTDPVVDRFNEMDPAAQHALGTIGGFGAVGLIAAGGLSTMVGQAIKAKDNLGSLASAASGLKTKLGVGGLATAVGAATAAFAVGFVALEAYSDSKKEARARAQEYADAIRSETGALKDNIDAVTLNRFANSDFATDLREAGVNLGDITSGVREHGDALDELRSKLDITSGNVGNFDQALHDSGIAGSEFGDALSKAHDNLSALEFTNLLTELGLLNDDYSHGKDVAANFANAQGGAKKKLDNVAGSATKAKEAVKALSDQQQAAFDPIFAVTNAERNLRDAQVEASEARKKGGDAYKEANLKVIEATQDAENARLRLQEAAKKDPDLYENARKAIERWGRQFGLTKDQAAQLRSMIRNAHQEALDAEGTYKIQFELSAKYGTWEVSGTKVPLDLGGAPAGTSRNNPTGIGQRAGGGDFAAGQDLIVGERGPERVRFNVGGTVDRAGSFGGPQMVDQRTINITNNYPKPDTADNSNARSLRKVELATAR